MNTGAAYGVAVAALLAAGVFAADTFVNPKTVASSGGGQTVVTQARTISVSGLGEVKATPDTAIVSLGVTSDGATAAQALSKNNEAMNALFATIKAAGIEDKNVQTSGFYIGPQYTSDPANPLAPPRVTGYQVTNTVTVRIVEIAKLGGFLDAAVGQGVNTVQGISFAVAETDALMDAARVDAVAEAKAHAKLMADAAGASLGDVLAIQENGASPPPMPYYALDRAVTAEQSYVPTAPGEQTISTSVTVTFELR